MLVNNAGGMIKRQAADALEWSLMEQIFALNTFSLMKISSLCVPLLRASKQDPNIVKMCIRDRFQAEGGYLRSGQASGPWPLPGI